MAGRDLIPGEMGAHGDFRDGQQYLNRAVRGQINSITPADGKMTVSTIEVIGNREITIPVLWFSAYQRTSSWGRYMPMGNEMVHLQYRNDGTAVFAGYDATNTKDGDPGWTVLRDLQREGKGGFSTFTELKRGEFDFKSSGNAYIFGSESGTLLLAGGQAYIKLENNAYRLDSKASAYRQQSEANKIKFGVVYRKETPISIDETAVPPGTFHEFLVDINQITPAGISSPQSKAILHFGDILDSTNIPEVGDFGAPLRGRISLGDTANALEVFKLEIDQLGNVVWEQNNSVPPAFSMVIGGVSLDITSLDNTVDLQAGGATLKLVGSGGITTMTVGDGAVHPAIVEKLQALYTQLKTKLDLFDAHIHPTGVGPSGPPTPMIVAPVWDTAINSTKISIPDG